MKLRFLSVLAGVAMLAACAEEPKQTATTGGAGSAATAPATSNVGRQIGPVPGSQEDLVANVGDRAFFDFDKYDLKPEARAVLERQATWLKKYPQVSVTIEGHADERGTRDYNLALGDRRANSVKDYLLAQGVSASRIKTISYGKERPAALGSNEAAWAQNRRAVTVVGGPTS